MEPTYRTSPSMSVLSSPGSKETKVILTEDLKAIQRVKREARFMVVAGIVALTAGVALFALGIVSFFTPAWGAGIFLVPFSCVLIVGGAAFASFAERYRDRRIKAIQEEAKAAMDKVGLSH